MSIIPRALSVSPRNSELSEADLPPASPFFEPGLSVYKAGDAIEMRPFNEHQMRVNFGEVELVNNWFQKLLTETHPGRSVRKDTIERSLDSDSAFFVVCQGKYLGYARLIPQTENSADLAIYLFKSSTGKGLGTKVMELIEKKAKEREYSDLYAKIEPGNLGSIGFFKKQGFEFVRDGYVAIGKNRPEMLSIKLYHKKIGN